MTVRLEYTKAHHLSTLHDELIAAGFHPVTVEGEGVEHPYKLALTFADDAKVDEAAVAAVVRAHDRAGALNAWEAARQAERDDDAAVGALLAELDGGGGVAARGQPDALVRAVALLLRLERRRGGA